MNNYITVLWTRLVFASFVICIPAKERSLEKNDRDKEGIVPYQLSIKIDDAPNEEFLRKKYAELLKLPEKDINKFIPLYNFIDSWMGTPYKWGGCSKSGIDCSCFVMTLFSDVFNINIHRTTFTQFFDNDIVLFQKRQQFELGDLIFFKTDVARETKQNVITHVGFYLANDFFVQSSSGGVNIANLASPYWRKRFVAAGRLSEKYYVHSRLSMPVGGVDSVKKTATVVDCNQEFEPVPYPTELDSLLKDYAHKLHVNPDSIRVPELLAFVDKNIYAPYLATRDCEKNSNPGECLIARCYAEVLGLVIDTRAVSVRSQRETSLLQKPNLPAACDMVIAHDRNDPTRDLVGIYLYNGYWFYRTTKELLIKHFTDPDLKAYNIEYYRLNNTLLAKGFQQLIQKRKTAKSSTQ
jgi:murein DD-endopeptidase / murein LD-carboxypeptidase